LDPKSANKTVKLSVFVALSGSASAKAARGTLMKLTPVAAVMLGIKMDEEESHLGSDGLYFPPKITE